MDAWRRSLFLSRRWSDWRITTCLLSTFLGFCTTREKWLACLTLSINSPKRPGPTSTLDRTPKASTNAVPSPLKPNYCMPSWETRVSTRLSGKNWPSNLPSSTEKSSHIFSPWSEGQPENTTRNSVLTSSWKWPKSSSTMKVKNSN